MTIQQLEYIVALDKYRHFVTAADKCNVTQPTLTMQVQKLEEEFGFIIFDRNKKPLEPTNTGEQIILKARTILREINELNDFIKSDKESLAGTYRLAIIPTLSPFLLPLFLAEFLKSNNEIHLEIVELTTTEIINRFNSDELDIAILSTPINEKSLKEIHLFDEPFLLYLPENHKYCKYDRIAPEIIKADELLLLDEGHCFRNQALKICNKEPVNKTVNFSFSTASIESLMRLTDKKLGYTLIPELAVYGKEQSDRVKRFTFPEPIREISMVVQKTFNKEILINRLKDSILASIPKKFIEKGDFNKINWR